MGIFNWIRGIFLRRSVKRNSKTNHTSLKSAQEQIVERYIKNDHIDIPFVPDFIERKIYNVILDVLFEQLRRLSNEWRIPYMKYTLDADVTLSKIRRGEMGRNTKGKKARDISHPYIDSMVKHYIDQENRARILPIPRSSEEKLYTNILLLIQGIIEDTLKTSSIQIIGRKISFNFEPVELKMLPFIPLSRASMENVRILAEQAVEKCNVFLIPGVLKKHLFTTGIGIALYFIQNMMEDTKVNIFHHTIGFHIREEDKKKR